MTAANALILVLAVALWGSVYWPVYLILRIMFIGQYHAETKASLIAIFWPVTIPLGLLVLTMNPKKP